MSAAMMAMVVRTRRRSWGGIAAAAATTSVIVTGVVPGRIVPAVAIDGKAGAIEDEIEWPCESLRHAEQSSGSDDSHYPDTLNSVG
jgi:hypothetical protein